MPLGGENVSKLRWPFCARITRRGLRQISRAPGCYLRTRAMAESHLDHHTLKNVNHGHARHDLLSSRRLSAFRALGPAARTALGHVVDSAGEPVSTIWVGPRCCRNGCSLLSRMKAEARARLAMNSAETQSSSSSPRRRAELAPHRGEAGVVFLSHAVSPIPSSNPMTRTERFLFVRWSIG